LKAGHYLAAMGAIAIGVGLAGVGHLVLDSASSHAAGTHQQTASACDSVPVGIAPPARISAQSPTALAFAPDGRLFWIERATGRVWDYEYGEPRLFARVLTTVIQADGTFSERGLTGLAISPSFNTDRYVYAMYSDTDEAHEDVIRWTDCGGVGVQPTTILTLPSGAGCCHKAGRIAFGPDGDLYVALGEEDSSKPPHPGYIPPAQQTGTLLGKILRYRPDGTVPPDNPFGKDNPTWVYGLRNPFGIAFNQQGQLLITMNGPSSDAGSPKTGYDTVILARRGGNYEWPYCYGYGHLIAGNNPRRHCGIGGIDPNFSTETETYVPTGPAWVGPGGPPELVGHWIDCNVYKGMMVFTPDTPHWLAASVHHSGCQLDVKQGPDGTLWYSDFKYIYRYGADS
jgi:glucose/arabinose dehydrogenase